MKIRLPGSNEPQRHLPVGRSRQKRSAPPATTPLSLHEEIKQTDRKINTLNRRFQRVATVGTGIFLSGFGASWFTLVSLMKSPPKSPGLTSGKAAPLREAQHLKAMGIQSATGLLSLGATGVVLGLVDLEKWRQERKRKTLYQFSF